MDEVIAAADVSLPTCVGIIMDGNRRWARAQGKASVDGHEEGYRKLLEVVRWARESNIPHVVAYVFSTENWHRPEEEVGYLMRLFRSILKHETKRMLAEHVRVRFVGDRSRFSVDMQKLMETMEVTTGITYDLTLHLLMSYGGRTEILAAANTLLTEKTVAVDENIFIKSLWSQGVPDLDLVIRTGGEKRLSNFLPWQSVYSELFFVDTLWPAFTREEFDSILSEFAHRERRHGK